jgi:hypothetical protein
MKEKANVSVSTADADYGSMMADAAAVYDLMKLLYSGHE